MTGLGVQPTNKPGVRSDIRYTDMQLDALRELANIASGTAATSLSQMLGRDVDLNVPKAFALPLADAVDATGDPGRMVTGVALSSKVMSPGSCCCWSSRGARQRFAPAWRRAWHRGRRLRAG